MAKSSAIETCFVDANGQRLFVRTAGRPEQPLLLFLHGFPEFGGAWESVLPEFADAYFAVAPDQRGYNLSSKPQGVDQYKAHLLAADMLALCDRLAPGRPIHLVGHDWGASIAYAMAFLQPSRIARLVVLNGVHPAIFQHALINDPAQREASQYIRFLRRDDAAALLLADGCRRVLALLTNGFGGGRWLTEDLKARYVAAYEQPGAMEAMVSWYKATPLVVPLPGEADVAVPAMRLSADMLRVRMPHLLLWGMADKALQPSCKDGLAAYCEQLEVVEVRDADHWIVHQKPEIVVDAIRRFMGG